MVRGRTLRVSYVLNVARVLLAALPDDRWLGRLAGPLLCLSCGVVIESVLISATGRGFGHRPERPRLVWAPSDTRPVADGPWLPPWVVRLAPTACNRMTYVVSLY
jgi:hypothetical protein